MKQTIIDTLLSTKREGIEKLINYMEENGFFEAPCSGAYHLAKQGGLSEHSLNVYKYAIKLNTILEAGLNYDSIVICSLLHDLGKEGDHGKPNYTPNYLKNGELSSAKPYVTNTDLLYVPHEIRSIAIAERFIKLSEEEEFSILYHNSMYGDLKYAYSGKETPLSLVIHFADMWACRVAENEKA